MFHQKIVLSFEIVVVEISLRFHRYVFQDFMAWSVEAVKNMKTEVSFVGAFQLRTSEVLCIFLRIEYEVQPIKVKRIIWLLH